MAMVEAENLTRYFPKPGAPSERIVAVDARDRRGQRERGQCRRAAPHARRNLWDLVREINGRGNIRKQQNEIEVALVEGPAPEAPRCFRGTPATSIF
jgi:hypothetical protein